MGSTGSQGFAELVGEDAVNIESALVWHLQSNHYPPYPLSFVTVCKQAIEFVNANPDSEEVWGLKIPLPVAVTTRDNRDSITISEAVEAFHLEAFLHTNE